MFIIAYIHTVQSIFIVFLVPYLYAIQSFALLCIIRTGAMLQIQLSTLEIVATAYAS